MNEPLMAGRTDPENGNEKIVDIVVVEDRKVSAKAFCHGTAPSHRGEMESPDGYAVLTGRCGDIDEFFLRISDGRIREARFRTSGCFFTVAACESVASIAEGKTVEKALQITQQEALDDLNGLPEDHEHCAFLAATALRKAVESYLKGTES